VTARSRVLVADDEASIRFVLREALEEAGHEVVDVDSGEAAWSQLVGGGFDVAFLDIRMPAPTGLELLDRLRSAGAETASWSSRRRTRSRTRSKR
jgi:CheY-like chemotaxis protein